MRLYGHNEGMSLSLRIILPSEIDEILDYENRKLAEQISNETERQLQSWTTRWRRESLEHYLPMGWSFLARDLGQASAWGDEGLLVGYFIAQPMLFLDGQTQSLWVEHLQYSSLQTRDELCDLALRLSREKHFQRVYFAKLPAIMNSIKPVGAEDWNPQVVFIKTTKVAT